MVYDLHSGDARIGQPDPLVWVQGHGAPLFGAVNSGLPLQQAFVVPKRENWASVEGAQWVSPNPDGNAAPEGYEYFTLFTLPPGYRSARLDVIWRADDQAELVVNDAPLPAPWADFHLSSPQGEFHGGDHAVPAARNEPVAVLYFQRPRGHQPYRRQFLGAHYALAVGGSEPRLSQERILNGRGRNRFAVGQTGLRGNAPTSGGLGRCQNG